MSPRSLLFAVPVLIGCPKAVFQPPMAPNVLELPATPRPPEARPRVESASVGAGVEVDGVGSLLPVAADPRVAILPLTGVPGVPRGATAAAVAGPSVEVVEHRLMLALLERGLSKVAPPDVLRRVVAEKEAERDGVVTWQASLGDLARVESVGAYDVLLDLAPPWVARARSGARTLHEFDPDSLDAYDAALETWREQVTREAENREAALDAWTSGCSDAESAYERAGGRYTGRAGEAASEARDRCDRVTSRLRELVEAARGASAPTRDTLITRAAQANRTDAVELVDVALRVRIVDGRDLRTLWLGDVRARDADLDAALDAVLDAIAALIPVQP